MTCRKIHPEETSSSQALTQRHKWDLLTHKSKFQRRERLLHRSASASRGSELEVSIVKHETRWAFDFLWAPEQSSTWKKLSKTSGHRHAHDPRVSSGLSSLQRNLVELWLGKVKRWKSASSFWKIGPMGFYSYFKICTTVWREKRWEGQKTFFFLKGSCTYIQDYNNRRDER